MNEPNSIDHPGKACLRSHLLSKQRIFQGGYLSVDLLDYEGDPAVHREVVAVRCGVCVLGVDREGRLALVRQFRQAIDRVILELPAGVCDLGEEPLATARRELSEETGLVGGSWTHLLHYAHAEGYSDGSMDLFLAVDCDRTHNHPDPGEALEIVDVSVAEFYDMVDGGAFVDAKTLLAASRSRQILSERWKI